MAAPDTREEEFRYPVGGRILSTPEEFAAEFLPGSYSIEALGPRVRATVEMLLRHAPADALDVLDYGCSTGGIAYQLAKSRPAWRISGWEGDHSAYEIARRYFTLPNLDFERKAYGEYRSFDRAAFDAILFLEVIEHVDNPGEILAAFARALRPSGFLLVSTPNFLGYNQLTTELWTVARLLLRRATPGGVAKQLNQRPTDPTTNEGHLTVYSLHTLSRLLNVHGFDIVSFTFGRGSGGIVRGRFPETLIVLARKRR